MPKKVKELSATEVRRLSHSVSKDGKEYNGLHPVGGVSGLLLSVTPTGAKSWILRTVIGTKRRNIGLGPFPDVSLAEARRKAQEVKDKIAEGIDPVEERKAARRSMIAAQLSTMTFAQAMAEYIRMKSKEFRNPRQEKQWTNSLTTYAVPHIGNVPVGEIELPHIKAVLDPIWEEKTETANRVRARMENILGWCAVHGYRSNENPAKWSGYLDEVYPSPEKIKNKGHHAALSVDAVPEFMKSLRKRTGTAAKALEFLILTASRTNEVIGDKRIGKAGITWQEIDLKRKVWTVPADRMKSGKLHRVPLTDAAVDLLKGMGEGAPDQLVFPGPKGDIPSNNFLSALLKRMDQPVTAHGFRSTFKDWAREYTAYADEVSELALAHINSDATRAAYARSELIDKRRLLMADWEKFCKEGHQKREQSNVVAIGGRE
ncbi:integrase arm-type DNA-binding domain-containing protein [Marinobacter sp. TBZ242]|uniref:Integrase arm-type DNA-binding domain-containing protein n=1 Tax=Marinobacter azerbaijanicus TaxID=3050455 RepID=A0ABT7I662_9GAMM|nr:site-specific integrase [Marinobacter sp. TBZ242]MDL0429579.1 integrase arm-type DNA-binding domain-containing protein [Marinobacter sp. TBZ242]